MLGHIPHLELSFCERVVDISALNHNEFVRIDDCRGITDYSSSFAFSRKIELFIGCPAPFSLNISRWTNVEELILVSQNLPNLIITNPTLKVPNTVKKCHLGGRFVSLVDFTISSNHGLKELTLSNDEIITSLEGYGLERVATVWLMNISSLQSLEGLGRGRNRKVIIGYCDKITDFNPLNHVPIVEITECIGFTNPLQLRDVQSLSVFPLTNLSFNSEQYVNIHSLTLLYGVQKLIEFDGLEHIPYLHLGEDGLFVLLSFLEKGREVYNQRIEFAIFDNSKEKEFLSTRNRFLQKDYDYFDKLPKRWIWRRKEISK